MAAKPSPKFGWMFRTVAPADVGIALVGYFGLHYHLESVILALAVNLLILAAIDRLLR